MKPFNLFCLAFLSSIAAGLFAQSTVSGIVIDQTNGEPLPFATVVIEGTTTGGQTDFDGVYSFSVSPGSYKLVCTFVGFESQSKSVVVEDGKPLKVDFSLGGSANVLTAVEVTAQAIRTSVTAVNALIQKTPSMLTGISRDDMRRAPGRSTADVLKRLSGTTIQDNRFVVIRGLNERYNNSLINGFVLPSTEPDRRAFSFDLFPSGLLDNLIIYKTATPDLPGEFAGGVVLLNTREIPEEDFIQITTGVGYNTQSTFRPWRTDVYGRLDWLGIDDGGRAIPSDIPAFGDYNKMTPSETQLESSKFTRYNWEPQERASMPLQSSNQITGAKTFKFSSDGRLSLLGSLSYNNTPRFLEQRDNTNLDLQSNPEVYQDSIYNRTTNSSAMLNATMQINPSHRILLTSLYNIYSLNQFASRIGYDGPNTRDVDGYQMMFVSNKMLNAQLRGEHNLGGIRINWGFTQTDMRRETPNMKTVRAFRQEDDPEDLPYRVFVSPYGNPTVFDGAMFFADQKDNAQGGSLDITVPFAALTPKGKNSVKMGLGTTRIERDFGARTLSFVSNQQGDPLFLNKPHEIFVDNNIQNGILLVREATVNSDFYKAEQANPFAFAMVDCHLTEELRLVTGVRYDQFRQILSGFNTDKSPVNIDTTYRNLLPSLSLIYSLSERSRLRSAVSRTVSRPTLREMAPFSYYNFEEVAIVEGEPRLGQATINNYDLRYEFFPTLAQLVAVNIFYKQFNRPIEQVVAGSAALSRRFSFRNAPSAVNYGAEFEYRFKLSQSAAFFRNLTFLGNLAYINSKIDLTGVMGVNPIEVKRPLQGQSPYVINSGINYNSPESGTDLTLMFNRIGRRIWQVGYENIPSIYEAPRSLFDINISQRVFKNGELRFTVQDILNQFQHFYVDTDNDRKFTPNSDGFFAGKDQVIKSQRFGTTFGASVSWKF